MGYRWKPFTTPRPTQHQAQKDRQRAIQALGRPLPRSSPVHHHSLTQLVICESQAYHMLLHRRTVALRFGYNPNTHGACYSCQKPYPFEMDKPTRKFCTACRYVWPERVDTGEPADLVKYPPTWNGKTAEELA